MLNTNLLWTKVIDSRTGRVIKEPTQFVRNLPDTLFAIALGIIGFIVFCALIFLVA